MNAQTSIDDKKYSITPTNLTYSDRHKKYLLENIYDIFNDAPRNK